MKKISLIILLGLLFSGYLFGETVGQLENRIDLISTKLYNAGFDINSPDRVY